MPVLLMPFIVIALEQQDDSEFLQKTKKDMKINHLFNFKLVGKRRTSRAIYFIIFHTNNSK
jgi:hypothetical protein